MQINLKVFRYFPENGHKPHYDTYIMDVDPNERVLDVLEQVRADSDPNLGYRRSCAHGVCGSDAMRINGRNALACKVLVKDLGTNNLTVEPLLGLKVQRDLIVDMDPFFKDLSLSSHSLFPINRYRRMAKNACKARRTVSALMIRPNVFFAPPAPHPARHSGQTVNM